MMLRDFKLAQSTFEILCQDFKNDKAWRHYAAANEMAAVSSLIAISGLSSKVRVESVDQYLETAYYSYITRVGAPYYALRTLVLGVELLKLRGGTALDDAARWASKILDDRLVGPVGHVLLMERVAASYTERKGVGTLQSGEKTRKAAFWNMLACDAWLRLEKGSRAERCITEAVRLYRLEENQVQFEDMQKFLFQLQDAVKHNRSGPQHLDGEDLLMDEEPDQVETLQDDTERLARRPSMGGVVPIAPMYAHRKSSSTSGTIPQLQTAFDPLGAMPSAYDSTSGFNGAGPMPLSPHAEEIPSAAPPLTPLVERRDPKDDGFE